MNPTAAQQKFLDGVGGVLKFQQLPELAVLGLMQDGDFGPRTGNAVVRKMLGLAPLRVPSAAASGVNRPDIEAVYGKFAYDHLKPEQIKTKKDLGRIVIDPTWVAANIVDKKLYDGKVVKLHKLIADEFAQIYQWAVEESGYHPVDVNGHKGRHTLWDPKKSLSTHPWCAVDFDPARNDTDDKDTVKGGVSLMTQHPKFLQVFRACGWACGADWSIRDMMHVQRAFV